MSSGLMFTLLVGAILATTGVIYALTAHRAVTRDSFLVANWSLPVSIGAVTVAATWVQAPALLFSGQQAYTSVLHFASFWIPNAAALVVAAVLVVKIRERLPRGYTVPQFMGEVFGDNVRWLSFMLAFATLVLAVGYTLIGMRLWLSPQLGLPAWQIALLLGTAAFAWVMPTGLPGAIGGDRVKLSVVVVGVVGVVVLWTYWSVSGHAVVNAKPTDVPFGSWWVLWAVGIPLAASLIGGPICNCDLGERFFALDRSVTRRAYLIAACIFAFVVLCFGSLGFLARNIGVDVGNGLVAFKLLAASASSPVVIAVTVCLAIILATALASFIASAGNLLTVELFNRMRPGATQRQSLIASRIVMVVPIVFGTIVASQEQIDIGTLLRALAVVRGEMIIPIILAAFYPARFPGKHILIGMFAGLTGGVALTYGAMISKNFFGVPLPFLEYNGAPLGAIFAVMAPLAVCIVGSITSKATVVKSI